MTSPHDRLDQAMAARRLDLDLRWIDVASVARIDVATLRAIRAGTNRPSPLTKRRIEEALRWKPGSIDAILAGENPTPADSAADDSGRTTEEILADLETLTAELRQRIERRDVSPKRDEDTA